MDLKPDDAVHLIAIANGGDGLAAATSLYLQETCPGINTWYTSINLLKPVNFVSNPGVTNQPTRTFLIDNSIKTGKTARDVLNLLKTKDVIVDAIISMLSYDDTAERKVVQQFSADYGVALVFLFQLDEVFEVTNEGG